MKRHTYIICFIAIVIVLYSCSDEKNQIGKWEDNIKLSVKTVEFEATADSVKITTEGDWWWVTSVKVNNENFSIFEDIDLESDNYSIKQNCFVVDRRDKNTLFIKVEENPNSIQRIITVRLEAGDYFDQVTITQAAR